MLAERDTWVIMLVYSITFGGFVGMSFYVWLLLINLYQMPPIDAGLMMAGLAFTGAILRPLGGFIADRVSGVRALLSLLAGVSMLNFIFAAVTPGLGASRRLLMGLYTCSGLGNGATFQLVPHRWKRRTGVMTGIVGAAGGSGRHRGFYLPVVMGIAKESTGNYQMGFAPFGSIAALAFVLVAALRKKWFAWAMPGYAEAVVSKGMPVLPAMEAPDRQAPAQSTSA